MGHFIDAMNFISATSIDNCVIVFQLLTHSQGQRSLVWGIQVDEIRVAIVGGAGFMGKAHSLAWALAAIQSPSPCQIVKQVLVEVDVAGAEKAARSLGWIESATDWKAVIDREDIDIVDIVTPPDTHAAIAHYAILKGKHVLCEKPLANSTDDIASLLEAAKGSPVATQVGFNYRHNAAIQLAQRYISEGAIGRILQVRFEYHQDAAFGQMGWRTHKATGGSGASSDIGSHIVDLAHYLVGKISSVAAALQVIPLTKGDDHDVDDAGAFLARFDGGALGVFSFSQKAWGQNNHIRFEIDGTDGALAFDWNHLDQLDVFICSKGGPKGFTKIHVDGTAPGTWFDLNGVGIGYLESSANQMIQLVSVINEGTRNSPTFAEGAYVQRVIDAVWASDEAGSTWRDVGGE